MLIKYIRNGLGKTIAFLEEWTRFKQIKRTAEQQKTVDERAKKLDLYEFYGCPFCTKTRRVIYKLNIPIVTRDAQNNPNERQALNEGGGRIQVPCLRIEEDDKNSRWMYESDDIIAYLTEQFGEKQ